VLNVRFCIDNNPLLVYCPNQNGLIKAQSASMTVEDTKKTLEICKRWAATEGVDKVMKEHRVDVIVAPCDSFFSGVGVGASKQNLWPCALKFCQLTADYPLASILFKYVESSGRPYGLHVIAKANEEEKTVRFMSVWKRTVEPRRVPDLEAL
jgi:amidase